jgi:hypothetical protein
MTAATLSKLPTDARAMIRDPDLAAAIEKELAPFSGKKLEAAQAAVRRVRQSGTQGTFSSMVERYHAAVVDAVQKSKGDD